MDNQHRQIKGYRELSEADIALMNKIKEFGPPLEKIIAEVLDRVYVQRHEKPAADMDADASVEFMRSKQEHFDRVQPERRALIARTHFQEGLMALTRAVAQPTFF